MILGEFVEATSRLEKYFGKEYTNEQRQIMFEELSKMPLEKFKNTIAVCIRTCKFLPKIADIIQASNDIDNTTYETKMQYEPCKICGGRGIVKYFKVLKENGYKYEFACRCICKNGENYNKKIQTYEELGIKPNEEFVMEFE